MKRVAEIKWICDICAKTFDTKRACDLHEHRVHRNEKDALRVSLTLDSTCRPDRWSWRTQHVWVSVDQFMLNIMQAKPRMVGDIEWYCFCNLADKARAKSLLREHVREFVDGLRDDLNALRI